ncbi:hypothetical protein SAMN04489761_1320 [Tenacibaculum sp. MAR_2009_124]|uniref:hypothetical protein n=1 Tax=Tenacibaculum sp. MAR_2009_124 TaxID=1250059 RepID=UPI0008975CFD|nr:hypothetical protein [Tenacibaculum sp. MAR_2009_124]SEB54608.1 hypothetical protein SAMN04489761_1320 [Tenacibaculum sp. MAR_2009_124]
MKKITFLLLVSSNVIFSQIDANSLFGLPKASTTEMNSISLPNEGSILYNTTIKGLYFRDDSSWQMLAPVKNITSVDPFLTITNTESVFQITTTFKDVTAELIFEDDDYCYVSLVENGSDFLVIRYDKTDINVEARSTGTGTQPNTLSQVQALTYN